MQDIDVDVYVADPVMLLVEACPQGWFAYCMSFGDG